MHVFNRPHHTLSLEPGCGFLGGLWPTGLFRLRFLWRPAPAEYSVAMGDTDRDIFRLACHLGSRRGVLALWRYNIGGTVRRGVHLAWQRRDREAKLLVVRFYKL
jgi:hypothetical protein